VSKLFNAYMESYKPEIFSDSMYYDCIGDLLQSPEIQMLAGFIQHQNITSLSISQAFHTLAF